MLIEKGKQRFLVRIYLGRDPRTGKRKEFNKTFHGSRREAKQFEIRIKHDYYANALVMPSKMTLNDLIDEYLTKEVPNSNRITSLISCKQRFQLYVRPRLGKLKITDVTAEEVVRLITEMLRDDYSPNTIHSTVGVLSAALNYGVRRKILSENSARGVKRPQRLQRVSSFTVEQTVLFVKEAAKSRNGLMFEFALHSGARPSEYCALSWDDFDLDAGLVKITRSLMRLPLAEGGARGKWSFEALKTRSSRRVIEIDHRIVDRLKQHREEQRREIEIRRSAGLNYDDHNFVFSTKHGTPHHKHNINKYFRAVCDRISLPSNFTAY